MQWQCADWGAETRQRNELAAEVFAQSSWRATGTEFAPVDEAGARSGMAVSARRCLGQAADTDASSAVGFDAEVDATERHENRGEIESA